MDVVGRHPGLNQRFAPTFTRIAGMWVVASGCGRWDRGWAGGRGPGFGRGLGVGTVGVRSIPRRSGMRGPRARLCLNRWIRRRCVRTRVVGVTRHGVVHMIAAWSVVLTFMGIPSSASATAHLQRRSTSLCDLSYDCFLECCVVECCVDIHGHSVRAVRGPQPICRGELHRCVIVFLSRKKCGTPAVVRAVPISVECRHCVRGFCDSIDYRVGELSESVGTDHEP